MKTLAEIYEKYRGVDCHSGTDKNSVHSYLETYEEILAPYRSAAQRVLEIGIMGGHSLRMWEEYFTVAKVHGADVCDRPVGGIADLRPMIAEGTHLVSLLDAADPEQVRRHFGSLQFDVVIEDAGHALSQQLAIYANFRPLLAPGAIYVIEDVEDIDRSRLALERIDPDRRVRIIDLRPVKGRFDDVLVVVGGA